MLTFNEWLETRFYYGPKHDPARRKEIFQALNSDGRLFDLFNAISNTKAGLMKFDEPLPGYKNGIQRLDIETKTIPVPNDLTPDQIKFVIDLSNKLEPEGLASYDASRHIIKVSEF